MDDRTAKEATKPTGLSRRALLLGAGAASAVGVGGFALGKLLHGPEEAARPGAPVSYEGENQAGIARPGAPQQHCLVAVIDLDLAELASSLAALGERINRVTSQPNGLSDVTPDGPGDLTVTVGLGGEALARTAHPELAKLVALPDFAGDNEVSPERRGGTLLLSVNATDPIVLEPVLSSLLERISGASIRWSEFGYRGPAADGATRNPFGYVDGIIRPRTPEELRDNVWITEGPLAGGTICVIRSFQLDVDRFRALAPTDRDAVFGRTLSTGAPLSGGVRDDQIDLDSKSSDGSFLVPASAHARAAHPAFTGSSLMLRRSYSYRNSERDHGHLFISFQNDVQTFARTQLRMDDMDALSAFISPTATAAFALLPGVREGSPLGSKLF